MAIEVCLEEKIKPVFFVRKKLPSLFSTETGFSILATFLLFEIVCQQRNLAATLIFNFRKFHFNFKKLKLSAAGEYDLNMFEKMKLSAAFPVDLDFQF